MKVGIVPVTFTIQCTDRRGSDTFSICLSLCDFRELTSYAGLIEFLHPEEKASFSRLKHERRKQSYLLGRFVAKHAVSVFSGQDRLEAILIDRGVFHQPIVSITQPNSSPNIQVTITHCDGLGAAIAYPEKCPLGIDVEAINPSKYGVLQAQATVHEKELLTALPLTAGESLTLLWTAKEALSKVLKTGFTVSLDILEIDKIEYDRDYISCFYKHFPLYQAISFQVQNYFWSIVFPKNIEPAIDWVTLKSVLGVD